MADLSAFTLGLFDLTAETSLGEQLYDAIWANLNAGRTNFAQDHGATDAKVYALAMGLARMQAALGVVGDQIDPTKLLDLLPARETEYAMVVPATATIADRRKAISAAMLAAVGGTFGNIRQALADTLGADFLGLHITSHADAIVWPSSPGDVGNFIAANAPRKLAALTKAISTNLGSSQVVHVAMGVGSPDFAVGDKLEIVDLDITRCEPVTVEAVGAGTITITPQHPHDVHGLATVLVQQPFPLWQSTKRYLLVVLTNAAAQLPEKRRLADNVMRKMVRAVSTWAIAGANAGSTTTSGPFVLDGPNHGSVAGAGLLGVTTIGAVTVP